MGLKVRVADVHRYPVGFQVEELSLGGGGGG